MVSSHAFSCAAQVSTYDGSMNGGEVAFYGLRLHYFLTAEACQLLCEVEGFAHGLEGVVVGALGGGSAWAAEEVGEESRVPALLVGYEFDEETVAVG